MEIERKFLLKNEDWRKGIIKSLYMKQGYICTEAEHTVRVRIAGSAAYITIKGRNTNISRPEYEYQIPIKDAKEMLEIFCSKSSLEKTRHIVEHKGHTWEVDEFMGIHKGLTLAEIELEREEEKFDMPDWLGQEVSNNPKYYNSNLVKTQ